MYTHKRGRDRLTNLFVRRGIPEHIPHDNDTEFTAKAVRSWFQRLGRYNVVHRTEKTME